MDEVKKKIDIKEHNQRGHFPKFYVCALFQSSDIRRKFLAQIYRAQYGAAMLVYLCDILFCGR